MAVPRSLHPLYFICNSIGSSLLYKGSVYWQSYAIVGRVSTLNILLSLIVLKKTTFGKYLFLTCSTVPAISNLTFLWYAYGMVLHMVS